MDFIKLITSPQSPTIVGGQLINNLDKAMWVERYQEPGEFSFEAKTNTGLKDFLPEGTLVTHMDTLEMMIVENQEITETLEDDSTIVITGRSFVSWLENRVIGINQARSAYKIAPYEMVADYPQTQIKKIIDDHAIAPLDPDDALDTTTVNSATVTGTPPFEARIVEFGTVWERVFDLLKMSNLGIKTVRRNTFGGLGSSSNNVIYIYKGVDRSASVLFSWKSGDLETAKYLFSGKSNKNSVMTLGQYLFVVEDTPGLTGFDRRTMMIDGKSIDGDHGETPVGADETEKVMWLTILGRIALANQNKTIIMASDMSKMTRYEYRKHFNVGDLVTVDGNFDQIDVLRIVEYAEIQDENGESGHPTLALPGV
jgi:hypothetical protein